MTILHGYCWNIEASIFLIWLIWMEILESKLSIRLFILNFPKLISSINFLKARFFSIGVLWILGESRSPQIAILSGWENF